MNEELSMQGIVNQAIAVRENLELTQRVQDPNEILGILPIRNLVPRRERMKFSNSRKSVTAMPFTRELKVRNLV